MTYVALLRGINVGGRNLIRMDRLQACFDRSGFHRPVTFIQSGNVVFESTGKVQALEATLEATLSTTFSYSSTVVVRSLPQLRKTLAEVPPGWRTRRNLRCNIAFVKPPVTAAHVLEQIDPRKGVDFVEPGKGVVYVATLLSEVKNSRLPKLVTKPVYQSLTIRNYNSCQRLLELMEAR
jgi:uncharacterized protein (DUF1697 family)